MKKIILVGLLGLASLGAHAGERVSIDRFLYAQMSKELIPTFAEKELINEIKKTCGTLKNILVSQLKIEFTAGDIRFNKNFDDYQVNYPKYKASALVECNPQE